MSIVFLGRGQMNALRGISRDMFPKMPVKFRSISPEWGSFDEAGTRKDLAGADLVVAQAVEGSTTFFNSQDLMQATSGDVIFVPYIFVDGIASLESYGLRGGSKILGSEQVLDGQEGRSHADIFDDLCRGHIDMQNRTRIDASLTEMSKMEEAVCDLQITDYIAETYRDKPSFFGVDQPAPHILFEVFRKLCAEMALEFDKSFGRDPVMIGRHALPLVQRAFTPVDVEALKIQYGCDPHWYRQASKLLTLVLNSREPDET